MLTDLFLLAQSDPVPSIVPWANIGASSAVIGLLIWIITKAFPDLLDRHDKAQIEIRKDHLQIQLETRNHFEKILTGIDTSRSATAKEGHDAAKQLSIAINESTNSVRSNTRAIEDLTSVVNTNGNGNGKHQQG